MLSQLYSHNTRAELATLLSSGSPHSLRYTDIFASSQNVSSLLSMETLVIVIIRRRHQTKERARDYLKGDIEGRLFFYFNFISRTTASTRAIYLRLDGTGPLESTQVLWVGSGVESQPARTGECLVKHPWPLGHQSAEVAPGWYETSPPASVAGTS